VDQLFEVSSHAADTSRVTTCETTYFGLVSESHTASSCISSDATGKQRWSPYPPFRFAVEFWDVDSLKEKSRLHSHTVWYAGSLFNVYVQVVRKKGIQLGVYLHRQSSIDPVPPSSAPSSPSTERPQNRIPSPPPPAMQISSSPSVRPLSQNSTRTTSQTTSPVSALGASPIPAQAPRVTPSQPYRDPRGSISMHFTISCASGTGSSMTRFTSGPDVFSVGQSWGWKSSSLGMEGYLKVEEDGQVSDTHVNGSDVSLRATVVLGIV
jgi:hypothetical protein